MVFAHLIYGEECAVLYRQDCELNFMFGEICKAKLTGREMMKITLDLYILMSTSLKLLVLLNIPSLTIS